MPTNWDVTRDARLYFEMRNCVAATCRLTPRDELEAIETLSDLACGKPKSEQCCWLLLNRRDLLRLALRPDAPREPAPLANASMWKVSLRYPQYRPGFLASDMSMRIVGLDAKSFLANFVTLRYSRPEEARKSVRKLLALSVILLEIPTRVYRSTNLQPMTKFYMHRLRE